MATPLRQTWVEMHNKEKEQLAALAQVHVLLENSDLDYWLFGGWAVDFYAGSMTRSHDDLDIAVWAKDNERIGQLLTSNGWEHAPLEQEDGYTSYVSGPVRLEVAYLARDDSGVVYTPLENGRAAWPQDAFGGDTAEVRGVRARLISLSALKAEKSETREDPVVAAKDRRDREILDALNGGNDAGKQRSSPGSAD